MHRRTFLRNTGMAAAMVAVSTIGSIAAPVFTGSTNGVAINGYDPVGYFTESKPVKGSAEFSHTWDGKDWHFASEENRSKFAADPVRYAPKYGGFCAYAMASGYQASTVPEAWSIVDDKLYLNYSLGVRKRWDADQQNYIKLGDKNWPKFKQ